mmetsp:Transcript_11866/g.28115  ORF Transcript_11866/g.28115 Transcript_11866/m.28115 type:complete len:233 (+) Transcript_11866:799-1497(+)
MLMRKIQPMMIAFDIQNSGDPHLMPSGDGNAPPPFSRFMARTTTKRPTRILTLNIGVSRSSSRIFVKIASFPSAASGPSVPPGFSPSRTSVSSRSSSPAAFTSSSISFWVMCVSSLSLVPSGFKPSRRSIRDSVLYIFTAFFSDLYAVKERSRTSMAVRNCSGRTLLRNAPTSAPAIVSGSITKIRSQSMSGRSASGCLFRLLRIMFAMAPPKTVTFDRGIPCLGENPMTSM